MKNTIAKYIGILIALVFILRLMITGAALTTLPDSAHAEQDSSNANISNVLDYEVMKSFEKRKMELNNFEERLNKKEAYLSVLKESLEERMAEFNKIKISIEELVRTKIKLKELEEKRKKEKGMNEKRKKEKGMNEKSLKHLVKVYETMKPENAAPLIEKLERSITIEILSRMKGKNVGKILSKVKPSVATKISEQIAKRK